MECTWCVPVLPRVLLGICPGSKNKLSKRRINTYLKHREFRKLYDHGENIAQALGVAVSAETFNPVLVDFYAQVGYLPGAVLNYLVLLGWSLDDRTEFFSQAVVAGLHPGRGHQSRPDHSCPACGCDRQADGF